MNCAYLEGWNLVDLIMCTIIQSGIPLEIFVLGILLAFIYFATWARLDFNMSLALASMLVYALLMINPGNYFLTIIMGLLIVGLALRMLMALVIILRW